MNMNEREIRELEEETKDCEHGDEYEKANWCRNKAEELGGEDDG
jgi:hypothetical protein